MVQPKTIPNNVWKSWSRLWKDPKYVQKSEINAKNYCGGSKIATKTHTGGSISVGEHRKRLEKYQEILQQQMQTRSDIGQCKEYYQAAGGEKKRRVYDLGSQEKCYCGPNIHGSLGSDATSSTTPPNSQSTPTGIWMS